MHIPFDSRCKNKINNNISSQSVDNPEMRLERRADRKVDGLPNAHEIAL